MAMHSTSAPSIAPHGGTGATTGRRRRGGGTRSTESAGHQRIQRAPAHLQNAEPRSWCHTDIFDSSEDSWGFFTKKKLKFITWVYGTYFPGECQQGSARKLRSMQPTRSNQSVYQIHIWSRLSHPLHWAMVRNWGQKQSNLFAFPFLVVTLNRSIE